MKLFVFPHLSTFRLYALRSLDSKKTGWIGQLVLPMAG